eukprot:2254297-Rhodomonas_salina.1
MPGTDIGYAATRNRRAVGYTAGDVQYCSRWVRRGTRPLSSYAMSSADLEDEDGDGYLPTLYAMPGTDVALANYESGIEFGCTWYESGTDLGYCGTRPTVGLVLTLGYYGTSTTSLVLTWGYYGTSAVEFEESQALRDAFRRGRAARAAEFVHRLTKP